MDLEDKIWHLRSPGDGRGFLVPFANGRPQNPITVVSADGAPDSFRPGETVFAFHTELEMEGEEIRALACQITAGPHGQAVNFKYVPVCFVPGTAGLEMTPESAAQLADADFDTGFPQRLTAGALETVQRAVPFAREAIAAFGGPDLETGTGPWDQSDFEAFRNRLPQRRLADDESRLNELFNYAASVPELKRALCWAKAHGVRFMVDHSTNAYGYYSWGTGIVAIAENLTGALWRHTAVGTLVHEIRHAWQDYHGMLPTADAEFSASFIKTGLMEADASAHGDLARDQFCLRQNGQFAGSLAKELADEEAALWKRFHDWYRSANPISYGTQVMAFAAQRLGIKAAVPHDFRQEFRPKDCFKPGPGIEYTRDEQLRRLGKGFDGRNYFNKADRRELYAEILSPSLAMQFFGHASRPSKLAQEVWRRELKDKHGKAPALPTRKVLPG
jgi:hypothetical protein